MTYQEEIAAIVARYGDEIKQDIRSSLSRLDRARKQLRAAEDEVVILQGLLTVEQSVNMEPAPESPATLHEAMRTVLSDYPEGLRAADIAAEIAQRRLYRMRDGRHVEPQQIHARVGNYPQLFQRDGSSIKLTG